ncbi:MAG: aldo/keto reductase [Polyangiaceae bacterium]|nr:aldo/keto reductase [Polyangiaceae bacterium]
MASLRPQAGTHDASKAVSRREAWHAVGALTTAILVPSAVGCGNNQASTRAPSTPKTGAKPEAATLVQGSPPEAAGVAAQPIPTADKFGALLPQRMLGPNGPAVTMLGVGGAHVLDVGESMGQQVIEAAIEHGIRFFDTAAMYGDGASEKRYGQFLVPKYREVSFIMSKAHARNAQGVQAMLENTLRNLNTDYLDLWQMHDLTSEEDVENRLRDGVVDYFAKAQAEGKVRHIGFTGHTTYKAHLRMLTLLKERGIQATSAQMPINVVDPHYESFALNVVPRCVENNVGVLAMKTLAYGRILGKAVGWARKDVAFNKIVPEALPLEDALGFVWSLPTSVVISGMQSPEEVAQNARIARSANAWTPEERQQRVDAVKGFSGPSVEFYKA